MSAANILSQLREKMGVTIYGLGKRLDLKSSSHAWMMCHGQRNPNFETCRKIIKLGKEYGMSITLDMIRGDDPE